jgi:hypothetical protein
MVFAAIATAAAAAPKGVPLSEALSGIFGSISMAAWMCLMVWLEMPSAANSHVETD